MVGLDTMCGDTIKHTRIKTIPCPKRDFHIPNAARLGAQSVRTGSWNGRVFTIIRTTVTVTTSH